MKTNSILSLLVLLILTLPAFVGAAALEPVTAAELKKIVQAESAKHKVIVVNVWATWCEPCKKETPVFIKFKKDYAPRGVQVLLVSADKKEDRASVESFLKDSGVNFTTYLTSEPPEVFIRNWEPRWAATVPATFIFKSTKPEAKQTTFWVGETNRRELERKVKPLLK